MATPFNFKGLMARPGASADDPSVLIQRWENENTPYANQVSEWVPYSQHAARLGNGLGDFRQAPYSTGEGGFDNLFGGLIMGAGMAGIGGLAGGMFPGVGGAGAGAAGAGADALAGSFGFDAAAGGGATAFPVSAGNTMTGTALSALPSGAGAGFEGLDLSGIDQIPGYGGGEFDGLDFSGIGDIPGYGGGEFDGLDFSGIGDIPGYGGEYPAGVSPDAASLGFQLKNLLGIDGAATASPGAGLKNLVTSLPGAASTGLNSLASGAGGAAGAAGGTSSLLKLLGAVAPAALGAYASSQQADAQTDLANKYLGLGAPSRGRYESSFAPGFTMENDPGYMDSMNQSARATLHGLSTQGNPADSPNAWQQSLTDLFQRSAYPALQNYRAGNANAGGISTFAPAGINAEGSAIGSRANIFNSIGSGAANIFNPPKSGEQTLIDILKAVRNG